MAEADPTFSIVVPVYNVADYLDECLASITGQSYRAFDVVVVDDASTDESAAIADRHAAADPRISVVRLPANVGLGGARNAGLLRADAPYLLFVDSDDALAPGALEAIAQRIEQTDSPDVVLFGHALTYPDGREVEYARAHLLRRPDVRPTELLDVLPTAWNKAYRRAFVTEHDFRFPPGTYEDVPWSYSILMTADRVVTLDRVCYLYRQRAGGSILSSSGRTHLDLVDQYARLFDYIDAHPELESWRRPVFDRLARHVPTVLEMTARIPPAERRMFFESLSRSVRQHRPSGYRPAGRFGLKVWLLERGGYRVFRSAQLANRARRRLRARPS